MAATTEQAEQGVFPEWKHFLGTAKESENPTVIKNVVKRSGEITAYDRGKIEHAIAQAIAACEGTANADRAHDITDKVEESLRVMMAGRHAHSIPITCLAPFSELGFNACHDSSTRS